MIIELLFKAIAAVCGFILDLLPDWALPDWAESILDLLSWLDHIEHFKNVVPLEAIGNSAVFLLAASSVVLSIKTGRIGVSLMTGGGGSAR
jgi:hypothetical protein